VMLCGVCCGAGVGIGYFFGDAKIGLPIGAGLGIAAAESFLIGGTIYHRRRRKALRKIAKGMLDYDTSRLNWIRSKDLENLFEVAYKNGNPEAFQDDKLVRKAMEAEYKEENKSLVASKSLINAYKEKMRLLEQKKLLKMKLKG
ncbi:MAG: hypothetical protein ABIB71_07230, partial [Candidatus Woesearchaeota archaeon]